MRSMDSYFDHHGYLTMADGDGGDSCQKTGFYRYIRSIKFKDDANFLPKETAKFEQELDGLECPDKPGYYRRHPDPEPISRGGWWRDPCVFSRDQQRSLTIAMGAYGQRKRLYRLTWELIKRFGFYQNTCTAEFKKKIPDVSSPENWAEIFRAFWQAKCYWAIFTYPLILIGDAWKILGILTAYPSWKNNPDDADDDNLILSTLQARESLPTPLSYLARKLYSKIRPVAGYTGEDKAIPMRNKVRWHGPYSALAWKHREATGAPPLAEYSNSIVSEI